jgi:hypothetical protein
MGDFCLHQSDTNMPLAQNLTTSALAVLLNSGFCGSSRFKMHAEGFYSLFLQDHIDPDPSLIRT